MAYPVFLDVSIDGTKVEGAALDATQSYADEGDIVCITYSGGVVGNATPGSQPGGSQSSLAPISISKVVDESSPYLFQGCANGMPVTANFNFYHTSHETGKPVKAYTVAIENARICDVSQMSSDARSNTEEVAMENVSFVAGKVTVTWHKPSVEITWPE